MKPLLLAAAVLISSSALAQTSRTFDIEAYSFGFRITPPEFFVNLGDTVTLRVKGSGHGFGMDRYVLNPVLLSDDPITITFTADKSGEFGFACTQQYCGGGHWDMYGTFEVLGPDTKPVAITSFEPAISGTGGGDIVEVRGNGFAKNSKVFFGSTPTRFTLFINETKLYTEAPKLPAGTVPLIVRLPSGRQVTSTSEFTYITALAIASVTPPNAAPQGGTTVVIRGSGFLNGPTIDVRFGGVPATKVEVLDSETLRVTVPPHAPGRVDVLVTVSPWATTAREAFLYAHPKRRAVR